MGNYFYCEYCDFVKDRKAIQEMMAIISNNCSFNFNLEGCPCARAHNGLARKKVKWLLRNVGMKEPVVGKVIFVIT